jgi:hypothetical protein
MVMFSSRAAGFVSLIPELYPNRLDIVPADVDAPHIEHPIPS